MFDKNLIKTNENEKEKEKAMKFMGLHLPTLIRCHDPSLEISTTTRGTLIPRVMNTRTNIIMVFAIHTDMWMDHSRGQQYNVVQRGIRTSVPNFYNNEAELLNAASNGEFDKVHEVVHRHRHLLWSIDSQGNLPLHLAIKNGHKNVASDLISKYPQGSYALNHAKESPIYLAVVHQHKDLVEYMLKQVATDENATPNLMDGKSSIVFAAIKSQDQGMLQMILKKQPQLIKSTNEEGWRPLSYAAYHNYIDIVRYFLKKFPEKSVSSTRNKDESSSYPIHKACIGGHIQVLKLFQLQFPESFGLTDKHGRTILHLAAQEGRNKLIEVVKYLLNVPEGRKLVNKRDENGLAPLDLAKNSRNNADVVRLFA